MGFLQSSERFLLWPISLRVGAEPDAPIQAGEQRLMLHCKRSLELRSRPIVIRSLARARATALSISKQGDGCP